MTASQAHLAAAPRRLSRMMGMLGDADTGVYTLRSRDVHDAMSRWVRCEIRRHNALPHGRTALQS